MDWGPVGPSVFFMLSGYLITLSLWKQGAVRDVKSVGFVQFLAVFHARRIFRLLPVILILILLGALAGLPEYLETWAWHLTFTTNILLVLRNDWIGSLSHLWSLSMQEQFYLLWPLVLLVPRAFVPHVMVMLVALAAGFRLVCIETGMPEFARWFLLPGSLDAFATGGLVAWLVWNGRTKIFVSREWAMPLGLAALISLGFSRYLRFLPDTHPGTAAVDIFESAFFGWLLICLVETPESRVSRALKFRPLVFVGTVSYGIFVFHTLVAVLLLDFLKSAGFAEVLPPLGNIVLFLLASIAVAAVSWRGIERPLNRWVRTLEFDFTKVREPFAALWSTLRLRGILRARPSSWENTARFFPAFHRPFAAVLGGVIVAATIFLMLTHTLKQAGQGAPPSRSDEVADAAPATEANQDSVILDDPLYLDMETLQGRDEASGEVAL